MQKSHCHSICGLNIISTQPVLLLHSQDIVVLSLARMLSCNSTLTELGLSKHKMVDSQFESLVRMLLTHHF